jgi:dihydrofolate reductase
MENSEHVSHHTISLDGYIAGRDDSMDWAFVHGRPTAVADETMNRLGAILAGRRWYELANERWNGVEGITVARMPGLSSC